MAPSTSRQSLGRNGEAGSPPPASQTQDASGQQQQPQSQQRQSSETPSQAQQSGSGPPVGPSSEVSDSATKRRIKAGPRTSRACISCRKQKMKCDGAGDPPCRRCEQLGLQCSFERRTDYMLNPEDLAWQNRVETRLDTLTSAVDSLITFLQAQGPLPCPLMGAGAAQLVPTPDQSTPQTMMYGGTPPVSSSVTAQMPNQPLMPPGAYIPVAPPPELHMPPQHQRAQSQTDTQRLSRSASTAASSSTQPLEQPRQRSSSMPPPEAPVRAATRARSSSASHNLSMWAKPRPGMPSGAAVSATEPPPPAVPTPQPGPSASSSNSQADTNGSPSTRPNGHAPQAQAQAQASTQGQTQVASDTGTPIHEPLSKTRLSGLALRKSLSHAQRQQLEQALASQAAKEAEAEQAAQGTRRQSGSGNGSGSSNSSTSSGRPAKRARRESSRAPQNT